MLRTMIFNFFCVLGMLVALLVSSAGLSREIENHIDDSHDLIDKNYWQGIKLLRKMKAPGDVISVEAVGLLKVSAAENQGNILANILLDTLSRQCYDFNATYDGRKKEIERWRDEEYRAKCKTLDSIYGIPQRGPANSVFAVAEKAGSNDPLTCLVVAVANVKRISKLHESYPSIRDWVSSDEPTRHLIEAARWYHTSYYENRAVENPSPFIKNINVVKNTGLPYSRIFLDKFIAQYPELIEHVHMDDRKLEGVTCSSAF